MEFYTKDGQKIETATALAEIMKLDAGKLYLQQEQKKFLDAEITRVLGDGEGEGIVRVSKLKDNNQRLTDQVKTVETKLTALEQNKGKDNDDVAKVKQAMQADIDAATAKATEATKKLSDFQAKAQLKDHLIAANIKPAMLDMVMTHLSSKGIEEAGGIFTIGGKTLETAVKEFSGSDMGKEFTQAADHAGGGSGGSNGGGGKVVDNPFKAGPTFNMTKQAELKKTDFATAQRLAAEAGVALEAPGSTQAA